MAKFCLGGSTKVSRSPSDETVIQLCQTLIRLPSLSGQEGALVKVLGNFFAGAGADTIEVDDYGSLIACFRGIRPGPVILFDGHVDTVPASDPDQWTFPPFEGIVSQGLLYGRGSSDMKGAVSAMAVAAADFVKARKNNFAGTLVIAGVVQEESFEGVATRSISKSYQPDLVVIGEASSLNLNIGQRGRAEIKVRTAGVPAHSANPEKGFNAVYLMADTIRALAKLPPPHHPILGPGILELTDIKSSPYPGASVVPAACLATYDRRLLPGETRHDVMDVLQKTLSQLDIVHPMASVSAAYAHGRENCYTGKVIEAERFFPGWLFDENEWFVERTYRGLTALGFDISLSHYNFCTNGSHYAGEAGIPTIGFGPSREALAHIRDEYIEIDQLLKAKEGYQRIMEIYLTD